MESREPEDPCLSLDNLFRGQGFCESTIVGEMSSLISGGERERVNIRRGLGAGGGSTGPPAAGNGYGWGVEAPKSSAPPAKMTSSTSGQQSGGRGAMVSAVGGPPAAPAVPTDDPLVVKRLTSQVPQSFFDRECVKGDKKGSFTMMGADEESL